MATVYLAEDLKHGRRVAIKMLPPDLTYGPGVERFKREARIAASLDHPNIIPVHRISTGRLFWYAMKYHEGRSLEELMRALRPQPNFRQKAAIEQQTRAWPLASLNAALARIADTAKAARLNSPLEEPLAEALLLELGELARTKGSRQ